MVPVPVSGLRQQDIHGKRMDENIANGYASEQSVMNGWLGSEGHCKNIMNGSFKEMGAGREGNYWTQILAR